MIHNDTSKSSLAVASALSARVLFLCTLAAPAHAAAPIATDVYAASPNNTAGSANSTQVLLEATDADFDTLTYSIVSGPSRGTLGSIAGSSLSYTPDDDFTGLDTFTYKANDGVSDSQTSLATITVFDDLRVRDQGLPINGASFGSDFGDSTVLSSDGRVAAVSAWNQGSARGAVSFYERDNGNWRQRGQQLEGPSPNGWFGYALALSGDGTIAAIGAPQSDNTGKVFVYEYDGSSWNLKGDVFVGEIDSAMGFSVALSRDGLTLATGGPNLTSTASQGRIGLYRFTGDNWTELGSVTTGSKSTGWSIALSADGLTLASGNPRTGPAFGTPTLLQVYRFDGNSLTQLGADIEPASTIDGLGTSVALSSDGSTLVASSSGINSAGQVSVYRFSSASWTRLGSAIDGDLAQDQFGLRVALSSNGEFLAAGAPGFSSNTDRPGYARLFLYDGSDWAAIARFDGEANGDRFGAGIGLSDNGLTLIAGAPENAGGVSQNGQARVYELRSNDLPSASDVYAAVPRTEVGAPEGVELILIGSDRDPLNYSIVSQPANGSLGALDENLITYTPDAGFSGIDSFTYRVSEGALQSNVATATITVFDTDSVHQLGTDIDGEASSDSSGGAVAVSADGRTVAIGAVGNDEGGDRAGHIRVYRYAGGVWSQLGQDLNGTQPLSKFGVSVALSDDGTVVAGGAAEYDSGDNEDAGLVRVFELDDGGTWVQRGEDIVGEQASAELGTSLALSADGRFVAMGGTGYDAPNLSSSGVVRVYEYAQDQWRQLGPGILGLANAMLGSAVALSADGLIVAAQSKGDGTGDLTEGYALVHRFDGQDWIQLGDSQPIEQQGDRASGLALSADGMTFAIGAAEYDQNGNIPDNSGGVLVFMFDGQDWVAKGSRIEGRGEWSLFGSSVSLSADGHTLAIGGPHGPRIDSDAGHTRIYRFVNNAWSQLGIDIEGEQKNDRAGTSVALSRDGRSVAIGAQQNGPSGLLLSAGHVRVYTLTNNAPTISGSPPDEALQGTYYAADVAAQDIDDGDMLRFSIQNAPSWATFDTNTGTLDGTPGAGDVGTDEGIQISVLDSASASTALPPFAIEVIADADGDGLAASEDNCPDIANSGQENQDGDALGDACDDDRDGDGVANNADAFPDDASETVDTDGDGLGDNREAELGTDETLSDTDGDGFSDADEVNAGSDPLSSNDFPSLQGLNIILIKAAIDAAES